MTSGGYTAPHTLEEAVALLSASPGARVLAGGHGLLVEPNRSRIAGSLLVDLRHVPDLSGITRQADGSCRIGAMTTLAGIVASEDIRRSWPALVEAARLSGDPQVRNRATLGGSLAGADGDADLPALTLVLDAALHVTGPAGPRVLRADELFSGASERALGPAEVITAVTIPAPADRSGTAYATDRHAATLQASCGIAVHVALADDGSLAAARAAITGAVQHPQRLQAVEKALQGQRPSVAGVAAAAASAADGLAVRGDLFASADYRRHLARVLAERALKEALERAGARVV